ncbi:MAG TPA: hypothetical protein PKC28_10205 [Bdellovibrionales bacterium]|nr:hypothetical protein [Bdellovibrionales bacterium]
MATLKKLDTFILKDKHGLDHQEINTEAQASALRRSEVMEWSDIVVRESDVPVTIDGEYKCYTFDIWGVEATSVSSANQDNHGKSSEVKSGVAAAKEATP